MSQRKTQLWCVISVMLAGNSIVSRSAAAAAVAPQPGLLKSEFIFEQAPFQVAHASTIVETKEGTLLAAWFAGTRERALDVSIWLSRYDAGKWTEPREIVQGFGENGLRRYPCWNPVLFQPKFGPLLLFYKVGPSPEGWWGWITTSDNQGLTWSGSVPLPKDYYGPIRNKPVELPTGLLLCGSSTESAGWRVHMEWMRSPGKDFGRTRPLNSAREFAAIQPTILVHRLDQIQILCRTKQGRIVEAWSDDGKNWTPLTRTVLPNPNSALDAVMLQDGRALLVYNHSADDRGLLNVAVSGDGRNWEAALVLENTPGNEYSYPAVIQTRDGLVHITYSWKRERIRHVVLDPAQLRSRPMIDGQWP
jgi:predicted neuraminidase